MKSLTSLVLAAVLAASAAAPAAQARQAAPAAKTQQYVYMLRVVPRLHDQSKWTQKEMAATMQHLERLKQAAASGQVIQAGRTSEALDKTMGMVVFEADSPAAAQAFMEADPAVKAGVMTATLHPYEVVLQRKP